MEMYWRELVDYDVSSLGKFWPTRFFFFFPEGKVKGTGSEEELIEFLGISISPYLQKGGIFKFAY